MRLVTGGIQTPLLVFCALSIWVRPSLCGAGVFHLFTETIRGAEENEVIRYVLLAGGQKFSFVPPANWSVKADVVKRTITLLPQNLKAGITVRFSQESDGGTPELNAEALRERIQERYPGAKFTREFECATDGRTGLAFDLVRTVGKDTQAGMRIAFAPCASSIVEFELTTAAAQFADYHVAFSRMLNSFHAEDYPSKK